MVYRIGVKLIRVKANHETNLEESITVDHFGETKVRNLHGGWVVRGQKHILRDQGT